MSPTRDQSFFPNLSSTAAFISSPLGIPTTLPLLRLISTSSLISLTASCTSSPGSLGSPMSGSPLTSPSISRWFLICNLLFNHGFAGEAKKAMAAAAPRMA